MARICDESSSESEPSSDEELNESIEVAFQSAKKYLHKKDVKQTESRNVEDFIRATHRRIYDSFDSEDELESPVRSEKESCKETSDFKLQSTTPFIIDKIGSSKPKVETEDLQIEVFNIDLSGLDKSDNEAKKVTVSEHKRKGENAEKKNKNQLSSKLNAGMKTEDLYVNVDPLKGHKTKIKKKADVLKKKIEEPEIMKKCVLTDDYEKQAIIPTPRSKRADKKERKKEREKTKGTKWFNMPAQEVTEERKNDFLVYQMRKSLDPKRFYKSNDAVGIPKYYQFGTVVEHSADFYDSRIPKKQRKSNMVEELLADAKFRQYNKRRYTAIQEAKRLGTGPYDDMKKLKRHKKAK